MSPAMPAIGFAPIVLLLLIVVGGVVAVGVIALVVILATRANRGGGGSAIAATPYVAQDPFLSAAERSFLGVLDSATDGSGYRVLAKVRLADLIRTRPGLDNSTRSRAFNQISAKHVDFVLCHPDTLAPALVVELDDSSHARPDRRDRDDFVDAALAAAGIRVHHVPAARSYNPADVRDAIAAALQQ